MILVSYEMSFSTKSNNVFTVPHNWGPAFHPAHLDASPGAHNYSIDPLSYRASSVQPIHL